MIYYIIGGLILLLTVVIIIYNKMADPKAKLRNVEDISASDVQGLDSAISSNNDVQASKVKTDLISISGPLNLDNISESTQIASEVPFTPNSIVLATDVQAAIIELGNDKLASSDLESYATGDKNIYVGRLGIKDSINSSLWGIVAIGDGDLSISPDNNTSLTDGVPTVYTFSLSGVPVKDTDLIDKAYADATYALNNINASTLSFTATGNTSSTNVQGAIVELQSEIDGISAASADIITELTTATSYIPVVTDLYKRRKFNNATTIIVEEPTGTYLVGQNLTFQKAGVGNVRFNFQDEISSTYKEITELGGATTIIRTSTGWDFIGNYEEWTPTLSDVFLALSPVAYWNANDLTDGTISTWTDKTANAFQFITQNGTDPIVETRGDSNKEVSFATTDASMIAASNYPEIDFTPNTDDYTILFQLGDNAVTEFSRVLFGKQTFTGDGNTDFLITTNSSGANMSASAGGQTVNLSSWRTTIEDDFIILRKNGINTEIWRNNILEVSIVTGPDNGFAPWTLANRSVAPQSPSSDVSIRKVVMYDKILTTAEMTTLFNEKDNV